MAENKISYLNRTFDDYREALKDFLKKNYPQITTDFDDASIGSWLIDLVAAVGDNLSYHIDRAYSETNIETAQKTSSIYSLARSNGFKVPGPKGSMTEVEFSCELPVTSDYSNPDSVVNVPNWYYAPIIKKGTKLSSNNGYFEVMDDVNFSEQFNNNGISDRDVIPVRNANGVINKYTVTKKATVVSGQSNIYKQVITESDIKPFMEIVIPSFDVMNVESIIFKNGANYNSDPTMDEFMQEREFVPAEESPTGVDTYRFFEVESLLDQYRWGDDISTNKDGNQDQGKPKTTTYGYYDATSDTVVPTASITRGTWKPMTQKFITEFTDKGYLKVIFGSGEQVGQNVNIGCATDFAQYQISRMVRNNFLGKLPSSGWTMYILYRVGGGAASNVAAGGITSISYLNADFGNCLRYGDDSALVSAIKNSISVKNTIPSVSGKDAPSVEEIRNMVRYNNASQNRCVTLKDYESRVQMMPPRYGSPFRISVTEENNKVMMYLLGIDYLGKLSAVLPDVLVSNIINYLSHYRSINDYVEIKSGRIVNISFEVDLYVNRNYNSSDVVKNVINVIKSYMDINKHFLGEDIYVSDIEKEISKVDGVKNLIDLRIYNEYGDNYSNTIISQETSNITYDDSQSDVYQYTPNETQTRTQIDLAASDYILNSDSDMMFEVKYDEDIKVRVKVR